MKYKYYCRVDFDPYVLNFLQSNKIKYDTCSLTKTLLFDLYSDTVQCDELLAYIQTLPYHLIDKEAVFSRQEMEKANWYLLHVFRMGIETSNVKFTYDAQCPYTTVYGMERHRHLYQINPFVSKKTPKWKNRYHFCSPETGGMTTIFCSNYAKETIIRGGINGVGFMPVLKSDLKSTNPEVSQLVFDYKLPLESYTFVGDYEEEVCPFCGKINYCFLNPQCDNIRLNLDTIPRGIDAFGSKILFGWGFGYEPIVISKKFYNLIINEINENPKHLSCIPIG